MLISVFLAPAKRVLTQTEIAFKTHLYTVSTCNEGPEDWRTAKRSPNFTQVKLSAYKSDGEGLQ